MSTVYWQSNEYIGNMAYRVLMFCPQYKPLVGGAERQAEKLAKTLVRKGIVVNILTPKLTATAPGHEIDQGVVITRFPLFDIYWHIPKIRGLGPVNLMSIGIQIQNRFSDIMP